MAYYSSKQMNPESSDAMSKRPARFFRKPLPYNHAKIAITFTSFDR